MKQTGAMPTSVPVTQVDTATQPTAELGERRVVSLPALLCSGERKGDGVVVDLSFEGARFSSTCPGWYRFGEEVALTLCSAAGGDLTLPAVVRWWSDSGLETGLLFRLASAEQRRRLVAVYCGSFGSEPQVP